MLNTTADSFVTLILNTQLVHEPLRRLVPNFRLMLKSWCAALDENFPDSSPGWRNDTAAVFMALSSAWFLLSDSVHDPDELLQSRCFFLHVIWFIPPLLKVKFNTFLYRGFFFHLFDSNFTLSQASYFCISERKITNQHSLYCQLTPQSVRPEKQQHYSK